MKTSELPTLPNELAQVVLELRPSMRRYPHQAAQVAAHFLGACRANLFRFNKHGLDCAMRKWGY